MKHLRLAIVGPEESKWISYQKLRAISVIETILSNAKLGNIVYFKSTPVFLDSHLLEECILYQNIGTVTVTLVSGHCHRGGIDIWSEVVARDLAIDTELYVPDIHQWSDKTKLVVVDSKSGSYALDAVRLTGYKSRNVQIAKSSDLLYCIVPLNTNAYCKHCNIFGHPTNGGCWTMRYAKEKLGKETQLVVIE